MNNADKLLQLEHDEISEGIDARYAEIKRLRDNALRVLHAFNLISASLLVSG